MVIHSNFPSDVKSLLSVDSIPSVVSVENQGFVWRRTGVENDSLLQMCTKLLAHTYIN